VNKKQNKQTKKQKFNHHYIKKLIVFFKLRVALY